MSYMVLRTPNLGALLIGLFSVFAGKILCQWLLGVWNSIFQYKYLLWLRITPGISWCAASSGAFIGSVSHVFLDSLIHSDMQPFSPFSTSNGILHIVPVGWIYLLCVFLGGVWPDDNRSCERMEQMGNRN